MKVVSLECVNLVLGYTKRDAVLIHSLLESGPITQTDLYLSRKLIEDIESRTSLLLSLAMSTDDFLMAPMPLEGII
jgi:hypothetical protein